MQLDSILTERVDDGRIETRAALIGALRGRLSSHAVEGIGWLVLTRLADSVAEIILERASLAWLAEGTTVASEALVGVDNALLAAAALVVSLAGVDLASLALLNGVVTTPVMRLSGLCVKLVATVEMDNKTATSAATTASG